MNKPIILQMTKCQPDPELEMDMGMGSIFILFQIRKQNLKNKKTCRKNVRNNHNCKGYLLQFSFDMPKCISSCNRILNINAYLMSEDI